MQFLLVQFLLARNWIVKFISYTPRKLHITRVSASIMQDPSSHNYEGADQQSYGGTNQQSYGGADQQGAGGQPEPANTRTLWIGGLDDWMDENYLLRVFGIGGYTCSIRVHRDSNGMSKGFGFGEFASRELAETVLQNMNGQPLPDVPGKRLRLNWASGGGGGGGGGGGHHSGELHGIYVGDLDPNVSDQDLQAIFGRYPSFAEAKVIRDYAGFSKGFAFARFTSAEERDQALAENQGIQLGAKALRLNLATPRKQGGQDQSGSGQTNSTAGGGEGDPNNTLLFIGGVDNNVVSEEQLKSAFSQYGDVEYVRIPVGKGCAFVNFYQRSAAEAAFGLHGSTFGSSQIRVSWGRSRTSSNTASSSSSYQQPQSYGNQMMMPQYQQQGMGAMQSWGYGTQMAAGYGQQMYGQQMYGQMAYGAQHQNVPPLSNAPKEIEWEPTVVVALPEVIIREKDPATLPPLPTASSTDLSDAQPSDADMAITEEMNGPGKRKLEEVTDEQEGEANGGIDEEGNPRKKVKMASQGDSSEDTQV